MRFALRLENERLIELYFFLLFLCISLLFFSFLQMQMLLSSFLPYSKESYFNFVFFGMIISAGGAFFACLFLVLIFWLRGKRRAKAKAKKKRVFAAMEEGLF